MANNWSSNTPAATAFILPEIQVAHTQGVATFKAGYESSNLKNGFGMGLSPAYNLVPSQTPNNMMTLPYPATIASWKVNTNILASDFAGSENIQVQIGTAYKVGLTSSTSGVRGVMDFNTDPYGFTSYNGVGTLSSPPNVGDTNTMYTYVDAFINDLGNNVATTLPMAGIGTDGAFSNYWFTFCFDIPASVATKTYKFQITIEYV